MIEVVGPNLRDRAAQQGTVNQFADGIERGI